MRRTTRVRERFSGRIAGVGSASGVRVVVGRWDDGPWGPFADLMVEDAAGHRVLLAPDERTRDFVSATYTFDEVVIAPVEVRDTQHGWRVGSGPLALDLTIGGRTPVGVLLGLVPARVATSPAWCALTDPVARVVMRGVRTRGTAGQERREWYGATSARAVTALAGTWHGRDLGALAPVDPPCRFGFSSAPRRPSVTDVVTTIERGA
ncbi:hypothetical protein [Nocardioides sp. Soil805]|uniref:hypothetical protein n=1 Tax=Nocardioides sp. Soil805 TaxID=1736416 RepID=UPI001F35818F|nr:hypothetical protein [Nocardioides sp. Soil805]